MVAETPTKPRAASRADGTLLYALAVACGQAIAIPGACVTLAVPSPALVRLPRRSGAIEGVMTHDGRPLPVVSLARWLAPASAGGVVGGDAVPPADAAPAHGLVLLLRDGDTRIGLAVDRVTGVQRLRADQVHRLCHDEQPDELFQSAGRFGDDAAATPLLEPGRLMALTGVWAKDAALAVNNSAGSPGGGEAPGAAAAFSVTAAPAASTQAYATFRIADAHVALSTTHIGELLPRPSLRNELPAGNGVLGLCEWRGRTVPVVDLTGALRALPASDKAPWLCIVCEGEFALGLVVHEVGEIARLASGSGTLEPAQEGENPVVGRRLIECGQLLQVIDIAALLHRYPEAAISAPRPGSSGPATKVMARSAPAYMVFDAGGLFASPIDGVQQVVPVPEALRARLAAGASGTLLWRDQPVPVLPIADELVALPAEAARQLVVIRQHNHLVALTIGGVKAMVPRGVASRHPMRLRGRSVEVISVQTEDHQASYPVVDLRAGGR